MSHFLLLTDLLDLHDLLNVHARVVVILDAFLHFVVGAQHVIRLTR